MRARELLRFLRQHNCLVVRQRGSHARVRCQDGGCVTTVPVHRGEDLGRGLLAQIQRDLAPCLGEDWLDDV